MRRRCSARTRARRGYGRAALIAAALGTFACSDPSNAPAQSCPEVEGPSAPECPSPPEMECEQCPAPGTTTTTGEPQDPTTGANMDVGDVMRPDLPPQTDPWDPNAVQVGWAMKDITPPLDPPVRMRGTDVFATAVMDPITTTAMAIESPEHPEDSVVLVSVDLLRIPDGRRFPDRDLIGAVRDRVTAQHPELAAQQIIVSATHTHVAPYIGSSVIPSYADQIAETVAEAWENRQPAAMSYGLGHAVAGHNRIVTHHDGESLMIGSEQEGTPNDPEFSHMEGFEDHSVHLLYTFDADRRVTGVVVNVTCPAQVQRGTELSADFWHEVREELGGRLDSPIHILPQVSASGEIATTAVVEGAAEQRMARLRYPELESKDPDDEDWRPLRRKQIAHRIVETIVDVLPYMDAVMEQTPHVGHVVQEVDLPGGCPDADGSIYPVELHGIRISEISMITNPFELYLDYGSRIKGRSPAIQTFVVELAGAGTYLPTRRAVAGGGYGGRPSECSLVGPDGGDELVEASLSMLDTLWGQ